MTPAARVAAAADILDAVLQGGAAEQVLTGWARRSRFAGSGDRAAIRDLVFDALRRRRSYAALGGAETGRGLMLGALRDAGRDPAEIFTGVGHAPAPLRPEEQAAGAPDDPLVRLDCPDWLAPDLRASLGPDFDPVLSRLRDRAPVFVRVNTLRGGVEAAAGALAAEGIATRPDPLSATALEVVQGARRLARSAAYRDGLVELQDVASQAVVDLLPLGPRILDFCAGGGGKALALAARAPSAQIAAHDADAGRMRDLPARAARAGARIELLAPGSAPEGAYDLVLADAPCSGSGAWRRAPQGKWLLDRAGLDRLLALQDRVLDAAAASVAPGGVLAYATCSLLDAENGERVRAFRARHPGWSEGPRRRLTPLDGGDGFFVACLKRD
jgi:16S rRNA (cytosine967-C5)-methyltransferase